MLSHFSCQMHCKVHWLNHVSNLPVQVGHVQTLLAFLEHVKLFPIVVIYRLVVIGVYSAICYCTIVAGDCTDLRMQHISERLHFQKNKVKSDIIIEHTAPSNSESELNPPPAKKKKKNKVIRSKFFVSCFIFQYQENKKIFNHSHYYSLFIEQEQTRKGSHNARFQSRWKYNIASYKTYHIGQIIDCSGSSRYC